MTKYVCYGSFVAIKPLSMDGTTITGHVQNIGTTKMLISVGDLVLYDAKEIEMNLKVDGVQLHIVTHYRISMRQIIEPGTFSQFSDLKG